MIFLVYHVYSDGIRDKITGVLWDDIPISGIEENRSLVLQNPVETPRDAEAAIRDHIC